MLKVAKIDDCLQLDYRTACTDQPITKNSKVKPSYCHSHRKLCSLKITGITGDFL